MRTSGQTSTTYIPNNITLFHTLTDSHITLGHMKVLRGVGVIMLYLHIISISTGVPRSHYSTVRGRPDRSSCRSCIISTSMSLPSFLDWMKTARAISRGNPGVVQRSFQKET